MLIDLQTRRNQHELKKLQPLVTAIKARKQALQTNSALDLIKLYGQLQDTHTTRLDAAPISQDSLITAAALGLIAIEAETGIALYDTQILGALVLHQNKIAEMKTGEGKTLTAALAAIISAVRQPVYVVTVNDYLSRRDFDLLSPIFTSLGIKSGSVTSETTAYKKRLAYASDIIYVTNSELGFDYLRDNTVHHSSERVLATAFKHTHAIVDEVDSILIDEARTPLIIASNSTILPERYVHADTLVKHLQPADYTIDLASKTISLTQSGREKLSQKLNIDNLYANEHIDVMHFIYQALQANFIQREGVDYLVKNNAIELIDASTGRVMSGRRYNDGLMQAIEAKENVAIKPESNTSASITYQNLFRKFKKLSGMTGTAQTEHEEFMNIYKLKIVQIPTAKPLIRKDLLDQIYVTQLLRNDAVIARIVDLHKTKAPILVAAENVALSETISAALTCEHIPHKLLTARDAAFEAQIIGQAGQENAITITTNMSGRGTDIKLLDDVAKKTGLYVIGVGRNNAKRIDNQLRGRAGRQGDPGSSQFFTALDDDLMLKLDITELAKVFNKIRPHDTEEIGQHFKFIHSLFEQVQRMTEGKNYDARKQTLEYDDVLREQRDIVYTMRDGYLKHRDETSKNRHLIIEQLKNTVLKIADYAGKHQLDALQDVDMNTIISKIDANTISVQTITLTALIAIDKAWVSHMSTLESLRASMSYRGYAQTNPLIDYQLEAVALYDNFLFEARVNLLEMLNSAKPSDYQQPATLSQTPTALKH